MHAEPNVGCVGWRCADLDSSAEGQRFALLGRIESVNHKRKDVEVHWMTGTWAGGLHRIRPVFNLAASAPSSVLQCGSKVGSAVLTVCVTMFAGVQEFAYVPKKSAGTAGATRKVKQVTDLVPHMGHRLHYEQSMILSGKKAEILTPKMRLRLDLREAVEFTVMTWVTTGTLRDARTEAQKEAWLTKKKADWGAYEKRKALAKDHVVEPDGGVGYPDGDVFIDPDLYSDADSERSDE
jgi:hypothetical protein